MRGLSWGRLGLSCVLSFWGRLGAVWWASWGRLGGVLGCLGGVLAASWARFGGVEGVSGEGLWRGFGLGLGIGIGKPMVHVVSPPPARGF